VIDGIDAGGKPLSFIYSGKNPKLSLKIWLITLDVWGTYYPLAAEDIENHCSNSLVRLE